MSNVARILGSIGLCLLGTTSCVTYTGVSKSPDGQLYISGATSYVVFSSPWIRRCDVDGFKLNCEELSESPPKKKGAPAAPGSAASSPPASAPQAAPPAPPAPEPPAPAKAIKRK